MRTLALLLALAPVVSFAYGHNPTWIVEDTLSEAPWNAYHLVDGKLYSSQQVVTPGTICECKRTHPSIKDELPYLREGRRYCLYKDSGTLVASCIAKRTP